MLLDNSCYLQNVLWFIEYSESAGGKCHIQWQRCTGKIEVLVNKGGLTKSMKVWGVKTSKAVHWPVRSVPITLMANLATLSDLGRAYWVHRYDSNWIAKIYGDTHIHNSYKHVPTCLFSKYANTQQSAPNRAALKETQHCERDSGTRPGQLKDFKPGKREERGGWEASPAFPAGAGPAVLGWSPDRYGWRGCLPQLEAAELEGNPDRERQGG